MEKITFNEYINKIGIEFEGFYNSAPYLELTRMERQHTLIGEIKSDGSLSWTPETNGMDSLEITTLPLGEEGINTVLTLYDTYFKEENYKVNDSVGLHFHISLKNNCFAAICNNAFYDKFVEMFSQIDKAVYEDRRNNSYARMDIRRSYGARVQEAHFRRQSRDRYHFVNYCYNSHNTVEFRAYGGQYATIAGLRKIIQETIDLIGRFIDNEKQEIREEITEQIKKRKKENIYINFKKNDQREFQLQNIDYPLEWNFMDEIEHTDDLIFNASLYYGPTNRGGVREYARLDTRTKDFLALNLSELYDLYHKMNSADEYALRDKVIDRIREVQRAEEERTARMVRTSGSSRRM